MAADVFSAGVAAPIAEEASQRPRAAFCQRATEHIARTAWR